MLFILCEKTIATVCSALDGFYDKFPQNATIHCTKEFFKNINTKSYGQPPLLANRWLFVCSVGNVPSNKAIVTELAEKNVFIITSDNLDTAKELQDTFSKLEIDLKFIDNLEPPKEQVIAYILQNVNTTEEVAKYIYNRHAGYMPNLVKTIYTLASLDHAVTKKDVQKYTAPGSTRSIFDLANWLIGMQRPSISYEEMIKVIYDYQYGLSFLLKYLLNFVDMYLEVFREMAEGNLDAINAKQFYETTKNKIIKKLSYQRLLVIIDSYSKISVDKLFMIRHYLAEIKPVNYESYKLIYLVKSMKS